MDSIKSRICAMKKEETELQDRVNELDLKLTSVRHKINELQREHSALKTTEKRLQLKHATDIERVKEVAVKVAEHYSHNTSVEQEYKKEKGVSEDKDCKLEELVEELRVVQVRKRDAEMEYEKVMIRLKRIELANKSVQERIKLAERKAAELEAQQTAMDSTLSTTGSDGSQVEDIEGALELKLTSLQHRLYEVTSEAETAEREVNLLQLQINKCKDEYSKQHDMNVSLQKNIDDMVNEMEDIE